MSYFKATLITIVSFWASSSLIGMEANTRKANPGEHSYLAKDIQALMLFVDSDIQDKYNTSIPKDVKRIIAQQGCNIYCNELFTSRKYYPDYKLHCLFKDIWSISLETINHKNRIQTFHGKEIKIKDFDLITMNDEGRNIFYKIVFSVPHRTDRTGNTYAHPYPSNIVSHFDLSRDKSERDKLDDPLSQNEYTKALKLPLQLRRKVGILCTVKTIGDELTSYQRVLENTKQGICLGGIAGSIGGGAWSEDWQALQTLKNIAISGSCGAFVGAIVGFKTAKDHPQNKAFKVEEKSLLTQDEQEAIKKEQLLAKFTKIKPIKTNLLQKELTESKRIDSIQLRNRE